MAGVNYSRALSFSRRTSLSFGTGTAIVTAQNLDDPEPAARASVSGCSATWRSITRWGARGRRRSPTTVAFIFRDEFNEPFFVDVRLGLARRVDHAPPRLRGARALVVCHHRPAGEQRVTPASLPRAQLRYAISRFVAAFARYVYYQYDFGEDIVIESGLPRSLDRQGVRVGLTATLPLIR